MLPFLVASSFSARSFTIVGNEFQMDGKPFRYISGSFHYFRQDPSLWEDTIRKMANGGLNAIQTYVAWNLHEPTKGQYVWDGLADIETFLQICQKYNLYVILRPGPYICGEWDFGGLPYWLMNENIEFLRSADPVFLSHVDDWFTALYRKLNRYMYINGGNIIMVQIENEYGAYFACDKVYLKHLMDLARDNLGDDVLLFTVDNPWDFMEQCGADPEDGAYATVDFGVDDNAQKNFELQRNWNGGQGP
jgi:beta-galactosidase